MKTEEIQKLLQDTYALIAELWCSPQDIDMEEIRMNADGIKIQMKSFSTIMAGQPGEDLKKASLLLSKFLNENKISEEEYVGLFELEPKCPLYLGSHSFEEPKSCAGAGVSDRNKYMIDLQGVYKHFKQEISGNELPDYLPLMIDFLSISAGSKDDEVRGKFITEYFLPFLPPVRKKLEELKSPYLHLLDALEKLMQYELRTFEQLSSRMTNKQPAKNPELQTTNH